MQYKEFISTILKQAGEIAQKSFGEVSTKIKGFDNNQVLTETDLKISKLFMSKIRQIYPKDNVIDEESGGIDNNASFTWVIDPIDGTSNFANGLPTYGIMIGVLKDSIPVAGGIILPFFNEFYYAEKGRGAFCNGKIIRVTNESNLLKTLGVYAIDGYQDNPKKTLEECQLLAEIVLNIRNLRISNSCFDIMMVANGKYSTWLNRTSKIWDNVAPQIIVEEAGGKYTNFVGNPIDYSNPMQKIDQNFTVCASSPTLHKKIQSIISKFNYID